MLKQSDIHKNLREEVKDSENINPFDKARGGKSKIINYEIKGKTKDEAREKVSQQFYELEKKYGTGLVRNCFRMIHHNNDASGKIIEWVIKGHFLCLIPEKRIEQDDKTR